MLHSKTLPTHGAIVHLANTTSKRNVITDYLYLCDRQNDDLPIGILTFYYWTHKNGLKNAKDANDF